MSRPPISGRGRSALEYIEAFTTENGYPPTVREIGEGIGISSPSTVQGYLDALAESGYIERARPGSPRAIKVLIHPDGTTVETARPVA